MDLFILVQLIKTKDKSKRQEFPIVNWPWKRAFKTTSHAENKASAYYENI